MSLKIESLTVGYPDQRAIVDRWTATIGPGVTLLFGDTGSGKSSLLRALAGVDGASTGQLTLAGIALRADATGYRRHVYFPDPSDSTHDQRIAGDIVGTAAREHASGFALEPHLNKPLYMLSTGSRRKVWLAAALACDKALVLLDEPTGGLDAPSKVYLSGALAALTRQKERVVVVASSQLLDGLTPTATITLPIQGA